MMEKTWLWDRRISEDEARKILNDPEHEAFIHYAALLLSRSNEPGQVFRKYLGKEHFCASWQKIKRQMRKNKWNEARIIFWEQIYRHVLKGLQDEKSFRIRSQAEPKRGSLIEAIGREIRARRLAKDMTQKELAEKSGLAQQVISRIESGQVNASLSTLDKIRKALHENTDTIVSMIFAMDGSFTEAGTALN